MKSSLFKTLLLTGMFVSMNAHAASIDLVANLNTENEPFPVQATEGIGTAVASLDTYSGYFSWQIGFSDLTGPATAAHFHRGARDVSGPVVIALDAADVVDVNGIGEQAGLFTGSTYLTQAAIEEVLSGLWYINIHTDLNSAGEIRGQLEQLEATLPAPVPLPAAVWLLGAGVAGLLSIRKKSASKQCSV